MPTSLAAIGETRARASTGPGISRRTPPNRTVDVSSRNAAFHDGALAGVLLSPLKLASRWPWVWSRSCCAPGSSTGCSCSGLAAGDRATARTAGARSCRRHRARRSAGRRRRRHHRAGECPLLDRVRGHRHPRHGHAVRQRVGPVDPGHDHAAQLCLAPGGHRGGDGRHAVLGVRARDPGAVRAAACFFCTRSAPPMGSPSVRSAGLAADASRPACTTGRSTCSWRCWGWAGFGTLQQVMSFSLRPPRHEYGNQNPLLAVAYRKDALDRVRHRRRRGHHGDQAVCPRDRDPACLVNPGHLPGPVNPVTCDPVVRRQASSSFRWTGRRPHVSPSPDQLPVEWGERRHDFLPIRSRGGTPSNRPMRRRTYLVASSV